MTIKKLEEIEAPFETPWEKILKESLKEELNETLNERRELSDTSSLELCLEEMKYLKKSMKKVWGLSLGVAVDRVWEKAWLELFEEVGKK